VKRSSIFSSCVCSALFARFASECICSISRRPDLSSQLYILIYRNDGVGALYRGIDIELLKSAASNSVYFYIYTLLKHNALRSSVAAVPAALLSTDSTTKAASAAGTVKHSAESTQSLSVLLNLLIGCVAGSVTQLCVNPLNVVCTRMQTQSAAQSRSIIGTFQQVFSEGGWAAMYRYVLNGI
jgi:hypothetical protein